MIKLEKLGTGVRDALVRAQDEARALGHGFIGTEHLMIAIVSDERSRRGAELRAKVAIDELRRAVHAVFVANDWVPFVSDDEALSSIGIDLAAVRYEVEQEFGAGSLPLRVGAPAFTPRVAASLERAAAATERPGLDDVLRAILSDHDGVARRILVDHEVDADLLG